MFSDEDEQSLSVVESSISSKSIESGSAVNTYHRLVDVCVPIRGGSSVFSFSSFSLLLRVTGDILPWFPGAVAAGGLGRR